MKFIIKYVFIGLLCVFFDFIIFYTLTNNFSFSWSTSSLISFFFSTALGFYFFNKYVFINQIKFKTNKKFYFFLVNNIIALILNQFLLYIFIEIIEFSLIISKIYTTLFVIFYNFIIRKKLIFI